MQQELKSDCNAQLVTVLSQQQNLLHVEQMRSHLQDTPYPHDSFHIAFADDQAHPNNFMRTPAGVKACELESLHNYISHAQVNPFRYDIAATSNCRRVQDQIKPFKCDRCPATFTRQGNLKRHMKIHTGDRPFKCSVCNLAFTQQPHLKNHMKIHTGEKPFKCDKCVATFKSQWNHDRHMRHHTGEKPYKCSFCNVAFAQHSHCKKHMKSHIGKKPYIYEPCDTTRTEHGTLKTCMPTATVDKPVKHKKRKPKATIPQLQQLTSMSKQHSGKKQHRCDACNSTFASKWNLDRHTRTHTGEKPYKCDKCNLGFTQQTHLNKHVRSHLEKTTFQCDVCDKVSDQQTLQNHFSALAGDKFLRYEQSDATPANTESVKMPTVVDKAEKQFKCGLCSAVSTQQENLLAHMRMHAGDKLFKCDQCEAVLSQQYHQQLQLRIHTGEKPIKCVQCEPAFPQQYIPGGECELRKEGSHSSVGTQATIT